jgi:H+-transporting ATPase
MGSSRPSRWLVGSSAVDIAVASTLACCGIAMAPVPVAVAAALLAAAVVFAFVLDAAKVPMLRRLRLG